MDVASISGLFSLDAFMHYGGLVLCAIALVFYHIASRRIGNLPRIPTGFLLLYVILRLVMNLVPMEAESRLFRLIDVVSTVAVSCAAANILFSLTVGFWYRLRGRGKAPKITRDLALLVAYAVILLIVLRTRGGVNLVGLITTSAVLTAVIGLAAQNFLGNIFSSVSIQVQQPFRIGDWVEYNDHTGKVVYIGWEATHLKTFDEELVIVPNLDMAKSVIKNHSRPTIRHAMKIDVGVEYGASPHHVRQALLEICREEPQVLSSPMPVVRLLDYGDFAITYQLRFFYNDFGVSPDLRADMMNRIWYAFKRHNIRIPFPIRDVQHRHVERRFEEQEGRRFRAEALAQLSSVPILAPLSEEQRAELAVRLDILMFGDGEIIVHQGDPGDSLFILHEGGGEVLVSTGGGSASRVASLKPPAFFGEMSLLTGEPRSATVLAVGDTMVFAIDHELFRQLLVAHPEISEALAQALVARQAETSGHLNRQREEASRQAGTLLARIRSFFGI